MPSVFSFQDLFLGNGMLLMAEISYQGYLQISANSEIYVYIYMHMFKQYSKLYIDLSQLVHNSAINRILLIVVNGVVGILTSYHVYTAGDRPSRISLTIRIIMDYHMFKYIDPSYNLAAFHCYWGTLGYNQDIMF